MSIMKVDKDNSKTIEFSEFVGMMAQVRAQPGKTIGGLVSAVRKVETLNKVGGTSTASSADTTHSFSSEETLAFTDWINSALQGDQDLSAALPIKSNPVTALFSAVKDGLVLCKLINTAVPETIDERAINKTKLNAFKIAENLTLVVNSGE